MFMNDEELVMNHWPLNLTVKFFSSTCNDFSQLRVQPAARFHAGAAAVVAAHMKTMDIAVNAVLDL